VILRPIEDTYELWPWVRKGLIECAAKTQERYRPEDVYLLLQAKNAYLYVFEDDGTNIGFLIVQRMFDPDGPVLFVFALWGEVMRAFATECYGHLETLARSIGAKRIRMQSPRKGWAREEFFRAVSMIYERELTC